MVWLRAILLSGLVLVMLPLGAFAKVAAANGVIAQPVSTGTYMTVLPEKAQFIAPRTKPCRIALLPGTQCSAELLTDTTPPVLQPPAASGSVVAPDVILPDGITMSGHQDPPRAV
jgi:hypothetical protein